MSLVKVEGKSEQGLFLGEEGRQLVVANNSVVAMQAISNVWLTGPTFDMLILDSTGTAMTPTPTDGMPLTVALGDSRHPARYYNFQAVGSPIVAPTAHGPGVRMQAILNKPKLYHGVCKKAVVGTSSFAIASLAQECGLTFQVDSSDNDSMKWLPMGRKYGEFMGNIASHGWFGEDSAASVVAVTLDGEVRYRSLAKLAKAKPKFSFYYGVDRPKGNNNYVAYDMKVEDLSTAGIGQLGYSATRTRVSMAGEVERYDGVNVTQNNERVNVSSKIREEVGVSRVMLGAPDCGNTHANYDRAEYQNLRYRGTFGRQIALVVAQSTQAAAEDSDYDNPLRQGPDLLDPVAVYYLDPRTKEPKVTFGVISARTVAIVNGFYVERFNIAYQGEDSDVIQ
jgi:hypothetical protein